MKAAAPVLEHELVRAYTLTRRPYTIKPAGPSFEPRRLKTVLDDEVRSQGGDIRKILRDAWTGKCTECPKYREHMCQASKKHPYMPVAPGKVGVCRLRRPDGTFKRGRRPRQWLAE